MFDIQILLSNVKNLWRCSIQATQTLGPLGEALRAEAAEADLAMSLPKCSINFNGFQLFLALWTLHWTPEGQPVHSSLPHKIVLPFTSQASSAQLACKLIGIQSLNKHPPKLPASRYHVFIVAIPKTSSPRRHFSKPFSPNRTTQNSMEAKHFSGNSG